MEDVTINLTLTLKEVDVMLISMSKRPLDEVIDVFNKVRSQAVAQIPPAPVEPAEPQPE